MKYQNFIFESYDFDTASQVLTLNYSFDDKLHFTEGYKFDFEPASYNSQDLDEALRGLFIMAGVSYYKTYLAENIVIKPFELTQSQAKFFSNAYQQGLGEFFFVNKINPRTEINFPSTEQPPAQSHATPNDGILIGLGGGKDSLVTAEFLRDQSKVATWSLGHRPQLEPLVNEIGLKHFWVDRQWDKQLLELNKTDAYNGHVPISAILATVGTVVAVLSGYGDVVVSNENSANEPTLEYQGVSINHQYSKSIDFETSYQQYLKSTASPTYYYSYLRPLSELHIAKQFAQYFDKYQSVFSSCNQAFTHDSHHMFWDGTCSKCAFVFLALTPFVERAKLENLISGKNLLLDSALETTYKQLLGIEGDKPLECVGEIKESRAAMRLAQQTYPELAKYVFDIPEDYDYLALSPHKMPAEIYDNLQANLAK